MDRIITITFNDDTEIQKNIMELYSSRLAYDMLSHGVNKVKVAFVQYHKEYFDYKLDITRLNTKILVDYINFWIFLKSNVRIIQFMYDLINSGKLKVFPFEKIMFEHEANCIKQFSILHKKIIDCNLMKSIIEEKYDDAKKEEYEQEKNIIRRIVISILRIKSVDNTDYTEQLISKFFLENNPLDIIFNFSYIIESQHINLINIMFQYFNRHKKELDMNRLCGEILYASFTSNNIDIMKILYNSNIIEKHVYYELMDVLCAKEYFEILDWLIATLDSKQIVFNTVCENGLIRSAKYIHVLYNNDDSLNYISALYATIKGSVNHNNANTLEWLIKLDRVNTFIHENNSLILREMSKYMTSYIFNKYFTFSSLSLHELHSIVLYTACINNNLELTSYIVNNYELDKYCLRQIYDIAINKNNYDMVKLITPYIEKDIVNAVVIKSANNYSTNILKAIYESTPIDLNYDDDHIFKLIIKNLDITTAKWMIENRIVLITPNITEYMDELLYTRSAMYGRFIIKIRALFNSV